MRYAPIVDTRSNSVYGVEAVIGNFARRRSLPDPALTAALPELAAYSRAGNDALRLGFELPALMLSDRSLHRRLAERLAVLGLDAGLITVRVTTAALPQHPVRAAAICAELRATGCRLALRVDWSSRNHLARFPIDEAVLDAHFIANIDRDPECLRSVRQLLRFAEGIGVTVVADGVERVSQYEHLRSLGCRYVKGPFLGLPSSLRTAAATVHIGAPGAAPLATPGSCW